MGVEEFVAACERLSATAGERFVPPAMLKRMAQRGEVFYHL
jgi:3-hydroxyacyl-CoA dehydrogenase/enoyl-CoA hydratase/3-hydroxybutyryl-CoA epimerase